MLMRKLAAALLAAGALTLVSPAVAQNSQTLYAGATSVQFSTTFNDALKALNVRVAIIGPTMIQNGSAWFPVVAGAIDLDTASGNILHSGGLKLIAPNGSTQVYLQSFIIDTTSGKPMITGIVVANGKLVGRLPLFDLQLPAGFSLPLKTQGKWLNLSGVGVTLTAEAASALNSVFHVSAFTPGLSIGTAMVMAYA